MRLTSLRLGSRVGRVFLVAMIRLEWTMRKCATEKLVAPQLA